MTFLITLALATFFIWECFVRPLAGVLCTALRLPDLPAAYLKSLTAFGVALALYRWTDRELLLPLAAASLAGTLHLLSRTSETPKMATVMRGRARRGMPMPGP